MNRYAAFLCFLSAAAPIACESAVYKCTAEDGHTVYQDTRCVAGQSQVPLVTSSVGRVQIGGTGAVSEPGPLGSPQEAMQGTGLAVGMSDTRVLNLRGWGRPRKIKRTRAKDGWHEEWTYLSRTEDRRTLQFVNGTLTAAISEPMFEDPNAVAVARQVQ